LEGKLACAVKSLFATLCILPIALLTACLNNPPINPAELNFTWTQPERRYIAGTWVPTKETLRKHIQTPGKHELVLREDGTFSVTGMPFFPGDPGSGIWSLTKDESWKIALDRSEFDTRGRRLRLRGQFAPYLIHITVGDPDAWEAMLFERLPN